MNDCGKFKSKEDAIELLDEFRHVILHIQKQAEKGYKFLYGKDVTSREEKNFQLYYNEILISDTTIFFQMGDKSMAFLGHNVMNILSTTDELFCRHTLKILNNIIRNSTLISIVSERDRNKFFLKLISKIEGSIDRIKNG